MIAENVSNLDASVQSKLHASIFCTEAHPLPENASSSTAEGKSSAKDTQQGIVWTFLHTSTHLIYDQY